ncbi:MAG: major capsid protein [Microviridae sp.]|nr:MAG: major capsid protein [Microviridae sp.]
MSNKLFNSVKMSKPKRNAFDLSHEKKLSLNMGDLVPIYLQEVLPGDKFRVNTEMLMRFAPLVSPVMHRINVYTHFFHVPYRLLYDGWETFITGGTDGKQTVPFPTVGVDEGNKLEHGIGSLSDYFGVPVPKDIIAKQLVLSALPYRAYQLVYNEYYRDQTLTPPVPVTKDNVMQATEYAEVLKIRKRSWEKDYFSSALPWAQRGGEVELPADVTYKAQSSVRDGGGGPATGILESVGGFLQAPNGTGAFIDNVDSLGVTINDLRRSVRLQEWLEKNARGGARYIEQILSHFGVKSSNQLLQRPQFLGGGKSPVVISEVLSTFNNETVPGANMYGHGITAGNTHQFSRYFEEHGFIIGIMSVLPRTAYQQGVPKIFKKFDKFDYAWPEFAHLGEQEIFNWELYQDYTDTDDTKNNATFGYQSRYSEYKFNQSSVHGNMRDTLDFWHLGRKFLNAPALNAAFVQADPDTRIFAVEDPAEHHLYCQLYHNIQAIRPLPVYGTPML